MNYVKPELVDYSFAALAAKGAETSCFIDCTSDELCDDSSYEI